MQLDAGGFLAACHIYIYMFIHTILSMQLDAGGFLAACHIYIYMFIHTILSMQLDAGGFLAACHIYIYMFIHTILSMQLDAGGFLAACHIYIYMFIHTILSMQLDAGGFLAACHIYIYMFIHTILSMQLDAGGFLAACHMLQMPITEAAAQVHGRYMCGYVVYARTTSHPPMSRLRPMYSYRHHPMYVRTCATTSYIAICTPPCTYTHVPHLTLVAHVELNACMMSMYVLSE